MDALGFATSGKSKAISSSQGTQKDINAFAANAAPSLKGILGQGNDASYSNFLNSNRGVGSINDVHSLNQALWSGHINQNQWNDQFKQIQAQTAPKQSSGLRTFGSALGGALDKVFVKAPVAVAKSLPQSEKVAATGIARVLPGGTADIQAQKQQATQNNLSANQIIQLQKAGKISKASANNLLQNLSGNAGATTKTLASTLQAMPTRGQLAAGFAGTAADILTAGTLPELKGAGAAVKVGRATKVANAGTRAAAFGTDTALGTGAAGGTKKQIAESGAIGAALPIVAEGAGKLVGALNKARASVPHPPSAFDNHIAPATEELPKAGQTTATAAKTAPAASKAVKPLDEAGGVPIGNVQNMIEKHNKVVDATGNVSEDFSKTKGRTADIKLDVAKSLKNRAPLAVEDKQILQDYRDAKAAGLKPALLPEHLQQVDANVTALNKAAQAADAEKARLSGQPDLAAKIESRDPETYTHRIAQGKGSALELTARGDRQNPLSVGSLSKTTAGSKKRAYMAITDASGSRRVVVVKEGRVATVGEKGTDMGALRQPAPKKVVEFNDKQVMGKLNTLAENLGIKHERVISNRGNWAGRSMVGAKKITTKAASPERTLLHEIGHQIDEKYHLQKEFVNNPATKKELRALTDLRAGDKATPSFQKYVRKGEEKIATMFEAYIHTPDKFKELAPNSFKKFEEFLNSHDELKAITDIKPSLELQKNVVQTGEDQLPGQFIDKGGNKYKLGQATTSEITKATGQKYYVDPELTSHLGYADSRVALENTRFVEGTKKVLEDKDLAYPQGTTAPKGFKTTTNPYFTGYRMDPKLAEVLNDITGRGSDGTHIMQTVGRVARQLIVYMPIKHDLNELAGFTIDRGLSKLANPVAYVRLGKSLITATKEVAGQGPLYRKMLREGSTLMTADDSQLGKVVSKQVKELTGDQNKVAAFAKAFAMTPQRAYSALQKVTVWDVQDILNIARVHERMQGTLFTKPMSFEDALKATERTNFQYKVPSRAALPGVLGRDTSKFLKGDLTYFGPYTYDKFRISKNIVKGTLNVKHPVEALRSADQLAATAAIAFGLWPLVDKGVQKLSGDKNAHVTAPAIAALPEVVQKVLQGKESATAAAGSQISISTPVNVLSQLHDNTDSFTGKRIWDVNATEVQKAAQIGTWLKTQTAPIQKLSTSKNATTNKTLSTALSLAGASLPKNSPYTVHLQSLQYDSLPGVQTNARAQAKAGNLAGAMNTIQAYDAKVLQAAKADLKSQNKPIPDDQTLIKQLKKSGYYYQPKQSTIKGWSKPKKAVSGGFAP